MMRTISTVIAAGCLLAAGGCNRTEEGNTAAGPAPAAEPQGQAAAAKRFVNKRDNNFSAAMKEKYVDFAFDYPADWQEKIDPSESNFVQVAAPTQGGIEPFVLAVGNASASGPPAQRRQLLESLIPQFERQFGAGFQDFEVAWRGERRVGRYETLGLGFTGKLEVEGQRVNAAGRIDIIVPPDEERGVTLISVALSPSGTLAPDQIDSLPAFRTIYDSLRIGKEAR